MGCQPWVVGDTARPGERELKLQPRVGWEEALLVVVGLWKESPARLSGGLPGEAARFSLGHPDLQDDGALPPETVLCFPAQVWVVALFLLAVQKLSGSSQSSSHSATLA